MAYDPTDDLNRIPAPGSSSESDADLAQIPAPTAAPEPPKQTFGDLGKRFAAGLADTFLTAPGAITESLGGSGIARRSGQELSKRITDTLSPQAQALDQNALFGEDWSVHPQWGQKIAAGVAQSAPSLIQAFALGRQLQAPLAQAGVAEKVAAGMGRIGVPAGAAKYVGQAVEALPFSAIEGAASGGQSAADVIRQVEEAPIEQLMTVPRFNELFAATNPALSPEERAAAVRAQMAVEAGRSVGAKTGLWTGAVGAVTEGGVLGPIARRLSGKGVGEGFFREAIKGGLHEAGQEAPQSAGEQYLSNVGRRDYVDPTQDPWQNVWQAGAEGGVIGFALGGGADAATYRPRPRDEQPHGAAPPGTAPVAPPGAPPVNPPVGPNAGPISRAVQVGQQSGAIPTNAIGGPVDTPGNEEVTQPPGSMSKSLLGVAPSEASSDEKTSALSAIADIAAKVPADAPLALDSPAAQAMAGAIERATAAGATQEDLLSAASGRVPPPDIQSSPKEVKAATKELDAAIDRVGKLTEKIARANAAADKARERGDEETAGNAESLAATLRDRLEAARGQLESLQGAQRAGTGSGPVPGTDVGTGVLPADGRPRGGGDQSGRTDAGGSVAAAGVPAGRPAGEGAGLATAAVPPADGGGARPVVLQNRDRSSAASVAQMASIAGNPDPRRLSFSRDFGTGAPVVFANADAAAIPETQLGAEGEVVDAAGKTIPVRYAVVEADEVVASNRADGTPNDLYADADTPGLIRAVAGNGRMAGLQEAFNRGTAAGYVEGIAADARLHGVDPEVIRGMQNPVLVRVMRSDDVTPDIGDRSNVSGISQLDPVEQARTDVARVNLDGLEFGEDGGPAVEAVRRFIRAMPDSEQSGLMDQSGAPGRQAVDRLMAAAFAKAYESDDLVRLYAQATDPEARNVISALAQAAGPMARLAGAGDLDIRPAVIEAAQSAVNASRRGVSLSKFSQQRDFDVTPEAWRVVEHFVANARSAKRMAEGLRSLAEAAYSEAQKGDVDMFGTVPKRTGSQIINEAFDGQQREGDANADAIAGRPRLDEEGAGGPGGRQDERTPANDPGQPQDADRPADGQAGDFDLVAPTREDILRQQEAAERAAQGEQTEDEAQARLDAEREAADQVGFLRPPPSGAEQRDTSGDMFGGPTADDVLAQRERERRNAPEAGGMFAAPVDEAAAQAATSPKNDTPEPTEAQKDAGNYKKGHVRVAGLDITIENEAGTHRRPEWPALPAHYGYLKRTEGADGDQVDVFVKPGAPEDFAGDVFVIDQHVDGKFDEHKVMLGYPSQPAAAKAYRDSYTKGWKVGPIRRMTMDEFKAWLADGDTTAPAEQDEADETDLTAEQRYAAADGKTATIGDFGSKIGGARKDTWTSFKDRMTKAERLDVATEPLSKSWPAPDYQALLDGGANPWAVAFMHAVRDEIPAKPKRAWKLKAWAEQVKMLRDLGMRALEGRLDARRVREMLAEAAKASRGLTDVAGRAELYELVGHGKSLAGVRISRGEYSLHNGIEYKPPKIVWTVEKDAAATAFSNWPRELASGATREEAIANFKAKYAELEISPPASREATFEIYSRRGENGYWIGKKLGRNPAFLAGPFATIKEARAYKDANNAELVEKLAKFKEIPRERRDTNEPRVGEDMRDGQDVTPAMFSDAFGFRGVEFGNWVEQKRRQKDLNDAYDALMDMAAVLGVHPKALSLNGELGLAFGARGSGGVNPAAAHYEPTKVVINLTKKEGAGSLGHEWWHALDNYFSRMRGKGEGMMTESLDVSLASKGSEFIHKGEVRKEMVAAFGEVMKAIRATGIRVRSAKLDAKRTKEYWTTPDEMSARAFESYLIAKLQDQGASNDYLANIVDEKSWAAAEALGFELEDSYPYPRASEVPSIRAAFDHFFQTVETRETDTGIAIYEPAAQYDANAPRRRYAQAQPDLFAAPAGADRAPQPEGAGVPGDVQSAAAVQDTPAPQGEYLVRTIVGVEARRTLGASVVKTPEDAARATRYLYRHAVERFDGIVTDADGKPLAVVGGFKGALAQAAVYPATLMGEAVRIPGAARIWFSHNHPSGSAELSQADLMLNRVLADVFRGSGIEPMGTLAVTGKRFAFVGAKPGADADSGLTIPDGEDRLEVPVVERMLADSDIARPGITSPDDAMRIGAVYYDRAKAPGMMLLDNQNRVLAWVPVPESLQGRLRDTGGLNAIYRAASEANASNAIIVHGGELDGKRAGDGSVKVTQNIGAALAKIDVTLLDVINSKTKKSAANAGENLTSGPVFSRVGAPGMDAPRVTRLADAIARTWANGPEVVVVQDMQDMRIPEAVRREDAKQRSGGASGEPEGFFHGGKVYLVAGQLGSPADVVRVLAHEALGHYGLRGLYGERLGKILDQIANVRRAEVTRKAQEYGLDARTVEGRRAATEEILAEMAQKNPQMGFVKKAIAAIRQWLRELGFAIKLTDADIVAQMIVPARQWVMRGGKTGDGMPAFSRGATETRAADVTPLGFYSELSRKVEAGPGRADAANWKSFIRSQKGIKPDEIAWSGIEEFLDLQPGKVTKDAVLEYLAGNGVKVEEVMLGERRNPTWRDYSRALVATGLNHDEANRLAQAIERGDADAAEEAEGYGVDVSEVFGDDGSDATKFAGYRVPGAAENYRELLLTLPEPPKKTVFTLYEGGNYFGQYATRKEAEAAKVSERRPTAMVTEIRAPEDGSVFRSGHWDQPNVLAHVRIDERTDADGKRVLFVNEIQSDWGQRGRKHGFKTGNEASNFQQFAEREGLSEKEWRRIWDDQNDLHGTDLDLWRRWRAEANRFVNGTPRAPFVEKTDAWVALALKRAIRYALDNGFDRVAIVSGEQAAKMFNLSEHVTRLYYDRDGRGYILSADGRNGEVFEKSRYTEAELEGVVGKEIAQKIIDGGGKPDPDGDGMVLEGVDLKVEAKGMRGFYDKIVPTVAKDVLKKLGGRLRSPTDVGQPDHIVKQYANLIESREPSVASLKAEMDSGVVAALKYDQVLRAVVESLPVDVMNVLAAQGVAPEQFARDPEMLLLKLPVHRRLPVADGLGRALAEVGARLRAGLDAARQARFDREILPTLRASDLDSHVAAGILFPKRGEVRGGARDGDTGVGLAAAGLGTEPGAGALGLRERRSAELAEFLDWHGGIVAQRGGDVDLSRNPSFDITPAMRDTVLDQGLAMFSRRPSAGDVQRVANQAARAIRGATVKGTWRRMVNAWTDKKPLALQLLGRRQIVDVYGNLLPHLGRYSDEMQQYDADKNESAAVADELVNRWRKLADADALADLMHDATLAQFDPDIEQAGDADQQALEDRFDGLGAEAKSVYREARGAYAAHWNKVKAAIRARIERADLGENERRMMMEQFRDQFLQPIQGVYFPLARWGDYVITAKDADGQRVVVFAESLTEAQAEHARMERELTDVSKITLRREYNAARDSVSKEFVRKLFEAVDETSADMAEADLLKDAINQLYLTSLPDVSWAKHGIHRKGTPGYSRDARRAFAMNMFHGGYYLSKLRHADVLQDYLRAMQEHIEAQREDAGYDSITAQQVVNEMVKRHDLVMNPDNSVIANTLTGMGFVWFLGLSPASAIVNLSQTALVAYPIMAARFGYGKAADALTRASKEAVQFRNDLRGRYGAEENAAIDRAVREGLIDITQAHDLAGVSEGRDNQLLGALSPVMRAASYLFHQAEKFNRQATFIAVYRLARQAGEGAEQAYDTARDLTYKGHFDYACVDAETECLTLDGWKRYNELREGDVAIAVDANGRAVESRVSAVNIHRGAIPVTKFQSRQFSMVLTDNHDAVVQTYNSRDRKWQAIRKVRADSLKPSQHILRAPSAAIVRTAPKYGEDFAALLGWVAAEGWYAKYRKSKVAHDVRLAQSLSHNPEYVDEIRGILDRLGGEYKEYVSEKRQMVFFVLRRSLGVRVQAAMPDKLLTAAMLRDMPAGEMGALVDAFLKGDGSNRGRGDWSVGQKDGQNLDVIQAMAVMLGMRASQSPVDKQGRGMLHLGRPEAGHRSHVRPMSKERAVVDMVWCPTTEHGTWVARRGGRVFVTGNSSNRPRVMMGPVARVLLLFKQYGQNMIYTLGRNALLWAKGDREAKRALSGILVAHGLTAGMLGLPFAPVLLGLASIIGGSDDEPWDAEFALRNYLADSFLGKTGGEMLARGVFRGFFPGDISGRVGLDSLLIRDIDLTLEPNQVWREILEAALGPVIGIGVNASRGAADLARGDLMLGIQGMLPKAIADGVKTIRYATEGVKDRTGIEVLDEVMARDLVAQTLGFSPGRVREAYDARRAVYGQQRKLDDRSDELLSAFSKSVIAQDHETRLKTLQEIQHFNQINPTMAITSQSMLHSIQNRMRRQAQAKDGIYLPRKQRDLAELGRFANTR